LKEIAMNQALNQTVRKTPTGVKPEPSGEPPSLPKDIDRLASISALTNLMFNEVESCSDTRRRGELAMSLRSASDDLEKLIFTLCDIQRIPHYMPQRMQNEYYLTGMVMRGQNLYNSLFITVAYAEKFFTHSQSSHASHVLLTLRAIAALRDPLSLYLDLSPYLAGDSVAPQGNDEVRVRAKKIGAHMFASTNAKRLLYVSCNGLETVCLSITQNYGSIEIRLFDHAYEDIDDDAMIITEGARAREALSMFLGDKNTTGDSKDPAPSTEPQAEVSLAVAQISDDYPITADEIAEEDASLSFAELARRLPDPVRGKKLSRQPLRSKRPFIH
jgi:hypothetical protein